MKGKKHTTEDKIRTLRAADGGKNIVEICKEKNISEQTFPRWKRKFGLMEINEAKRLKELERENTELKKMLADSLLENRVLRFVNEINYEPRAQAADGPRSVFRAASLLHPASGASHPVVSRRATQRPPAADGRQAACVVRGPLPRRVPQPRAPPDPDRGPRRHRGLPHRLQYASAPPSHWLLQSRDLRRATSCCPDSGRTPASRRRDSLNHNR